jgi:hypothetical protein
VFMIFCFQWRFDFWTAPQLVKATKSSREKRIVFLYLIIFGTSPIFILF